MKNNIQVLRERMNLTQQALSKSVGIPYQSIVNYELGRREPNSKAMAILEKFFGVSSAVLRGEEEIPNAEPNLQNDTLARNLRRLRLKTGMTQRDLAECTGLSYAAIRSYEAGGREPGSRAMAILEDFFQVSGKYLRGETETRTTFNGKLDSTFEQSVYKTLSKRIKSLRKNSGLNQNEFAQLLAVDQTAVSQWETGKTLPGFKQCIKIAKILNCSLDSLVNESTDMKCLSKESDKSEERLSDIELQQNAYIRFDRSELALLYNLVHKEIMCAERLADIYDLSGKGNEDVKGELLKLAVKIIEMKEL